MDATNVGDDDLPDVKSGLSMPLVGPNLRVLRCREVRTGPALHFRQLSRLYCGIFNSSDGYPFPALTDIVERPDFNQIQRQNTLVNIDAGARGTRR